MFWVITRVILRGKTDFWFSDLVNCPFWRCHEECSKVRSGFRVLMDRGRGVGR